MLPYSDKKKGKNLLTVAFLAPKNTFLANFVNFGQLWMVVYTAIKILKLFRMSIGVT